MLKISVCIPCIEQHAIFLYDCFYSIKLQSYKPSEVIVALSNIIDIDKIKEYMNKLIKKFFELNIKVIYIKEKRFAGENRNIAASHANYDIISFIDADDLMRKDRLYIIAKVFELYPNTIGLLHHFKENIQPDDINCQCQECCENFTLSNVKPYKFSHKLHFGHSSFNKSIFNEYRYSSKPRGQDVEFIHSLLETNIMNMYIYEAPLTYYISNRSTFF